MLFWKEWREAIRTLPIAMVILAVVVYTEMPNRSTNPSNLPEALSRSLALWGSVYALVLGLLQTWGEQRTDVRGWLFSHPVARWQSYWSKTVAAFLVHFVAMLVPWTIAYVWLARVAPPTRPADPQMLIPGFWCYLAAFSFHPATVWMMARPSRWLGSKTVVLVPAIAVTALAYFAFMTFWATWAVALILGAVAFFVLAFPAIAQHTFVRQSNQPPLASDGTLASRLAGAGVIASVLVVGGVATAFVGVTMSNLVQPASDGMIESHRYMPDGRLVRTREKYIWDEELGGSEYKVQSASFASPQNSDADEVALTDRQIAELIQPASMSPMKPQDQHPPFRAIDTSTYHERAFGLTWFCHDDGYYLAYVDPSSVTADEPLLAMTLDRSGFGSTGQPFASHDPLSQYRMAILRFADSPWNKTVGLVDQDGIYEAMIKEQKMRVVAKMPIDEISFSPSLGDRGATALVLHDYELTLHAMESTEPGVPLPPAYERNDRNTAYAPMPTFALSRPTPITLPADWFAQPEMAVNSNWISHHYLDRGEDGFDLIREAYGSFVKSLHIDNAGQVVSQETYLIPRVPTQTPADALVATVAPPVFAVGFGGLSQRPWAADSSVVISQPWLFNLALSLGALAHGGLAWWLTNLACRRRALSTRCSVAWKCFSLLAGWITPLAVLSVHPRIAQTSCHECDRLIRVDSEHCPHCAANWCPPQKTGIEVFSRST
ncbi:hypothetical protein RISK_002674 [Rhodopirellula islandica]|uniref:Transmembrane protein n=2 Tax=Rhodopirellula islandica TaxID=595434 RepID=A0A0J1BFM1_RHOIS|nr:hypothetical protein RISK_002674 [Rhodopirellula islandica]